MMEPTEQKVKLKPLQAEMKWNQTCSHPDMGLSIQRWGVVKKKNSGVLACLNTYIEEERKFIASMVKTEYKKPT